MYTLCHLKAKTKSPSVYSQAAFIDVMKMYMLALKKKKKKVPALIGNYYKYITRNKTCWKKNFMIQSIF